jgi:hypothetical protein
VGSGAGAGSSSIGEDEAVAVALEALEGEGLLAGTRGGRLCRGRRGCEAYRRLTSSTCRRVLRVVTIHKG